MILPDKCLVDTNVPKTANLSVTPDQIPDDLVPCVFACVEAIYHVINRRGLVIDAGDAIFDEYRRQLKLKGQPGVGDAFMKWVHDNRWKLAEVDRVPITPKADSYEEFPDHEGLRDFDPSDRKFIAVANAHPEKPPILQATDSKWWGWREALASVGIVVHFLCPDYIEAKWLEKIGA